MYSPESERSNHSLVGGYSGATGRGGRRVGAGRKKLPEELKRQRRAMRKQITVSWNLCNEWESKKAEFGIKKDREFIHHLLRRVRSNEDEGESPLGTMRNYVTYINQLRHSEKLCDVILVVNDGTGTTSTSAHKIVLLMTSRYFRSLSKEDLSAKKDFFLQDVTAHGLRLLLDFMYGMKVDPVEHYNHMIEVTTAATVLQVDAYLRQARLIARRGKKIVDSSSPAELKVSNHPPVYFMMPNGQPGVLVQFPIQGLVPANQRDQQNSDVDDADGLTYKPVFDATTPIEEREKLAPNFSETNANAPLDLTRNDGSFVSEKSATFAARALDDCFVNPTIQADVAVKKDTNVIEKCDICKREFKHPVLLRRHRRISHPFRYMPTLHKRRKFLAYLRVDDRANDENTCKFCNTVYASDVDLKNHKATVHRYIRVPKAKKNSEENGDGGTVAAGVERRERRCDYCPAVFDWKSDLKRHIMALHRSQQAARSKCAKCPRTFSTEESLRNHLLYRHKIDETIAKDSKNDEISYSEDLKMKPMNLFQGSRLFDIVPTSGDPTSTSPARSITSSPSTSRRSSTLKGQWVCHLCSLAYNQRSLLMKHLQIIHEICPSNSQAAQDQIRPLNADPALNKSVVHHTPTTNNLLVEENALKASWCCHICDLPFGFRWSLLRHLELVHRVVGTHLDSSAFKERVTDSESAMSAANTMTTAHEPPPRQRSKTIRQMIESQDDVRYRMPSWHERDGVTVKELLEKKLRTRENAQKADPRYRLPATAKSRYDVTRQSLKMTSTSTALTQNSLSTTFSAMTPYYAPEMASLSTSVSSRSATPTEYGVLASPQELTAMVQEPLLPFTTSPTSSASHEQKARFDDRFTDGRSLIQEKRTHYLHDERQFVHDERQFVQEDRQFVQYDRRFVQDDQPCTLLDQYERLIPTSQNDVVSERSDRHLAERNDRLLSEDKNARRRHRLTGEGEPVPQPPVIDHEKILSPRVNIQRPAYSQMTFKLIKSKKDSNDCELKLWPQKETYDCTGCGMAFSRYQSYAKHMMKCQGTLPDIPPPATGVTSSAAPSSSASADRGHRQGPGRRSRSGRQRAFRHYDFKEYVPPENKFRYQYSV